MNILDFIEERKQFPIGHMRSAEAAYIHTKIESKELEIFYVVPSSFLNLSKDIHLRESMLSKWNLAGVFDLGPAWHPYTGVPFCLLWLRKRESELTFFSQYLAQETFRRKNSFDKTGLVGDDEISSRYKKYLKQVETVINNKILPTNQKIGKFWSRDAKEVSYHNLGINYYEPENRDAWEKLSQEKTVLLGDIAEIIKPRKLTKKQTVGAIIKTKDFTYPLDDKALSLEAQTSAKAEKGDILFSDSFSGTKKFYLVHESSRKPIFVSTFLTCIRVKSDVVTPEYLFLYLQSETAQKYMNLMQSGGFFPRMNKRDLLALPVILPDMTTQTRSIEIFKTLFLTEKKDVFKSINAQLFEKKISKKPVQKEFLLEEIEQIRMFKQDVLTKLIQTDLKELDECLKRKLYKSFLILSGSLLEAFLLDWLSELDNKNYFDESEENYTLGKLIWSKLQKSHSDIFTRDLVQKANGIKKKRDFVHPKEYFNSSIPLSDDMCNEIIADLRTIFSART